MIELWLYVVGGLYVYGAQRTVSPSGAWWQDAIVCVLWPIAIPAVTIFVLGVRRYKDG